MKSEIPKALFARFIPVVKTKTQKVEKKKVKKQRKRKRYEF